MFHNVIIGIDGQQHGADAVQLGRALVAPGGTLTLAHVHGGFQVYGKGMASAFEAEERQRAAALLRDVSAATEIDSVVSIGATSVGRGLHELAEARGADLLVLGSTRHGLIGRVLLGDDTRDAINGAPCAVAVAPSLYAEAPGTIATIGVGYDEGPEAQSALAIARELARTHGAKLSLFQAVPLPAYLYYGLGVAYGEISEYDIDAVLAGLREIEGVEPHAVFGDAAEELATYSADVDLLVVGSRAFGPVGRLVHSSTSRRLSRTARCPLLIVPRTAAPVRADVEQIATTATGADDAESVLSTGAPVDA